MSCFFVSPGAVDQVLNFIAPYVPFLVMFDMALDGLLAYYFARKVFFTAKKIGA
jgi:hypothetical protein